MANKELKMYFFLFLVFNSISFSPNHAFTFDIIAPYHPVPLFEQFLFFLTDISPFSAKEFLQDVLSNYSAIDDVDFLCTLAESYISPTYYQLMYAQLENGYFLPRGEMFRNIAMKIDNYSDLVISDNSNNLTFTYDNSIKKDIQFMSDIKFGLSDIYVYANLHNKTVASEILLMITSKASFILRPFSRSKTTNSKLSGFGFELSSNNYNSPIKKSKAENIPISDDYAKYKAVTDETIGRLDGTPPSYINPILYQRLGPKFARYIQKRNDSLPELLRDISANYPLFMPLILSTHETKDDQYSYQKVSNLLEGKPFSMSFLNGRHIQLSHTDLFNLFDILHKEHNLNAILERKYKIEAQTIKDITTTQMIPTDNLIIDYRSPYIVYINDLENDPQYENWTADINEIYNMTNKYPQIKKNIMNLILYANPTTQEGATSLFELVVMMQKDYPLRFGFMPFFNLDDKFERKVAYAFSYFASQNSIVAIQYLINVYEKVGINHQTNQLNQINKKFFKSEFNKMAKEVKSEITWNMLFFLYDSESTETQRLVGTYRYLKEHGIDKQSVLINGRYIQAPSLTPSILNIEFHASYLILQTLFTKHNIKSLEGTHIMDFLTKAMPTIETIDQRIYFTLPKGIDLFSKKLSLQVEFNDFLPKVNWNYVNGNANSNGEDASSFVWLFHPENANLSVFNAFMRSKNLSEPTMFAFNPPIPESIYHVNKSIVTLIFNGRVYENADICDINFLRALDRWSHNFVSKPLSNFFYSLKFKRRECMVYLACVYVDWMMSGVSRGSIGNEVWAINSSLVYKPDQRSDSFGLVWEMIVDPFSSDFQKIAPIVNYFDKRKIVDFRIVLVPPIDVSKSDGLRTLSTFYRMSIGDDKTCVFTLLNKTTSYSVVPCLPSSWLIENLRASFDMADFSVDRMKPGIHSALFVLSSLVVDGRCFTEFGDVAEGAELSVYDNISPSPLDTTTVMKMNGYWQLKVNSPGQFRIEVSGIKTKTLFQKVPLNFVMASFATDFRRVELAYNPSFAHYKVKDISKRRHHQSKGNNNEYLNIFSVCDGFKSEEMLTKMIISVIKSTKSPLKIKFWFVRSFLSPQFKVTLQKLALKYSISYCLTDYKWPNWLKWEPVRSNNVLAYKLLFLDLLFKSEKGRVLYMDPNCLVKEGSDLYKLCTSYSFFDKDHYSAPTFAFPHFGNTRFESEPLRFWKNGYWASYLQGKEFADTGLFLLDLKRYKDNGSADLLRYMYQIIPYDSTSKLTLDQYLINYIRVQLPIKILPDNYFGCDLWNDDKSMEDINIVYLCDNPFSKLSESDRASKYISEWPTIQEEAENVVSRNEDFMKLSFKKLKDNTNV